MDKLEEYIAEILNISKNIDPENVDFGIAVCNMIKVECFYNEQVEFL